MKKSFVNAMYMVRPTRKPVPLDTNVSKNTFFFFFKYSESFSAKAVEFYIKTDVLIRP